MIYYSSIKALGCSFLIAKSSKGVCELAINQNPKIFVQSSREYFGENVVKSAKMLKKEIKQLKEYFAGKRKSFDLKVFLKGTKFQLAVWKEISKIKYGKTISYKELAAKAGKPKAFRAAGSACGQNPVSIIIPCHRVVASGGKIGGFGGGTSMKIKLLKLEKASY